MYLPHRRYESAAPRGLLWTRFTVQIDRCNRADLYFNLLPKRRALFKTSLASTSRHIGAVNLPSGEDLKSLPGSVSCP